MLSKSSTLGENFILIPDVDWIELQITRNAVDEDAGLASSPGAPQRLVRCPPSDPGFPAERVYVELRSERVSMAQRMRVSYA